MQRPVIAITMGDAAGIGPELIVKVLSESAGAGESDDAASIYDVCRPFVIGDRTVMQEIAQVLKNDLRFRAIDDLSGAAYIPGEVDVVQPHGLALGKVEWGKLDPELGDAAAQCMKAGIELGQSGQVHGMVTGPMNKEAFHLAGYDYLDELAYLAELTDSQDTYIAGLVGSLWTAAVTEHVSLSDAVRLIGHDRILRSIRRLNRLLEDVGRPEGKIAVAALNPHGGEGGLFGRDEIEEIEPAVRMAQQDDIDARGPFPADTIFLTAAAESYDAVLCMYHDQANIARKLLSTWDGATLFMGLPIPCATTAHGTAFDKAGHGVCDPGSLRAALRCVAALAAAKLS